jgi:uncharacterized iron-regulated protein
MRFGPIGTLSCIDSGTANVMQILERPLKRLCILGAILGLSGLVACTSGPARTPRMGGEDRATDKVVVDPADAGELSRLLDAVAAKRVVYVGEIHDRYDHHLNQLAVIRGLDERGLKLAIGVEFFQEAFQPDVDAYLAGRIGEREMLRKTEYFKRWRYDFRLYRAILEYARDRGIPMIALNAPSEMVDAVSKDGIEGLDPAYRRRLPARIAPADADYERRMRDAFRLHGDLPEERFQRFMEVQSVWDEYMARRAAEYLEKNPDRTLVVLVGAAHVLHDSAIPQRLRQYRPVTDAVVVTRPYEPLPGVMPDFVFLSRDSDLEPPGSLGMALVAGDDGVSVHRVTPKGAAQRAGLEEGDRISSLAGEPVAGLEDVRAAMSGKAAGDRVEVVVLRGSEGSQNRKVAVLTLM